MSESLTHIPLTSVIAHRGASAHAPENTLSAMRLAATHGARCVEIDVSISADGVAFVHHDDTLERCTNGSGLLCEKMAAELDALLAGKNITGYESEPLPRLSRVLIELATLELGLNLEIKPYPGLEERTVAAIARDIEHHWPSHLPLVISSFSLPALAQAQRQISGIPRALLQSQPTEQYLALMQQYECGNFHCDQAALTPSTAEDILASGVGLYCYTVNDPKRATELFGWGVHGLFTDDPKRLLHQIEA